MRSVVAVSLVLGMLGAFANRARSAAEAPFEKEIRAFEEADQSHPPPKDAVLFVGSSSIRFWETLSDDFPDVTTIRRGFGGSRIADCTRYAGRIVIPYHPDRIVLYAGDNDLAAGNSPHQALEDFRRFVKTVRARLPDVTISFISIKPSIARWKLIGKIKETNLLVKDYCATDKHLDYIDVFTAMLGPDGKPRPELLRDDGLHCSRRGYQLWARIVGPRLKPPDRDSHTTAR